MGRRRKQVGRRKGLAMAPTIHSIKVEILVNVMVKDQHHLIISYKKDYVPWYTVACKTDHSKFSDAGQISAPYSSNHVLVKKRVL